MEALTIVLFFVVAGGGVAAGYFLSRILKGNQLKLTEQEAQSIKEMATREAEAHLATAAKMAGYQAAAAAPMKTLPDPKRSPFGVGTMPAKDTTHDVLGHG